ncbi:MAG: hypothetical protein SCH66_02045 [Methanolobus sp.]|nr:hypothetical protein [Methanolobus sp.]
MDTQLNFSIVDYSLVLTILGLLVYWFGMFHQKTSASKSDREDIYYSGALFFAMYIVLPISIYGTLYIYSPFLKNLIELIDSFSIWISAFLAAIYVMYFNKCLSCFVNNLPYFKEEKSLSSFSFPFLISLIFSWVLIFVAASSITNTLTHPLNMKSIFNSTVLLMADFIIMSMIAVLVGLEQVGFKKVIILTKGKSVKKGFILKQDKYVRVLTDSRVINIDNESIYSISECGFYRYDLTSILNESVRYYLGHITNVISSFFRYCREHIISPIHNLFRDTLS